MCSNIKISPKGFYKRNIVIIDTRDVPGGPVVKSLPFNKEDTIPGWQLRSTLHRAIEPTCCHYQAVCHNYRETTTQRSFMPQLGPDTAKNKINKLFF